MPEVAVVNTTWDSPEDFAWDVAKAFMQQGLSEKASMILTAHVANSTGWGKTCHNWSLAGIKSTSEAQDYVILGGSEYEGGTYVSSQMKWRAFDSLAEGAAAMLQLLQQPRYASAWAMLQAGDTGYWAEVGRNGWYTAPTGEVSADMQSRYNQIVKWLGEPAASSSGLLLAFLVGGFVWWYFRRA